MSSAFAVTATLHAGMENHLEGGFSPLGQSVFCVPGYAPQAYAHTLMHSSYLSPHLPHTFQWCFPADGAVPAGMHLLCSGGVMCFDARRTGREVFFLSRYVSACLEVHELGR
jgi:hypothetical protein